MKPATLALLAASLVTGTAATAVAQNDTFRVRTAGDLADLCGASRTEPNGAERINFCLGYAAGAFAMEQKRETSVGKKRICLPSPGPTREATMTEFVKWVQALPKNQILPPTDGYLIFMTERFPCK